MRPKLNPLTSSCVRRECRVQLTLEARDVSDLAFEELIDLLDDAIDEIIAGDGTVYSENEQATYLRCYRDWMLGGLSKDDIKFLRSQPNDYQEEEDDHG